MKYNIKQDLLFASKAFDRSFSDISKELNIPLETISRIINGSVYPSNELLEKIYSYIYSKNLKLNKCKVDIYNKNKNVLLFHGSKSELDGEIDLNHSREHVDFGVGFYAGDNYQQSLDFICQRDNSSIYVLDVDYSDLKVLKLDISLDWMLMIAINRGLLEEFKDTKKYKELIKALNSYDVIIAPIADNRMFNIIGDFTNYTITTEQAIHALKSLSLGNQSVFKTEKAIKKIKNIERLYICRLERNDAIKEKYERIEKDKDFAVNAYKKYLRQGLYISEVFDDEKA